MNSLKKNFIFLLLLFLLITNLIWLVSDERFFQGNQLGTGGHLLATSEFYRILKHDIKALPNGFLHIEKIYPPIPYIAGALLMFIAPIPDSAAFLNTILFLGTILCCYYIGKALFGFEVACLSSIFLSFFPLAYAFSRIVCVDITLMFFVTLFILVLIHSNKLGKRNFSILLGIIGGLGLLVKWVFPFFVIGPIIYSVILSLGADKKKLFKKISNMLIIAIVAFIISIPWYFANFDNIKDFARFQSALALKTSALNLFFSKFFFFMLIRLPNMITLPVSILFLIGVLVILLKKESKGGFLLLWYGVPYIFFATFYARTDRYFLPALPALAIISVYGLREFSFWIHRFFSKRKLSAKPPEQKLLFYSSLPFIIIGFSSMIVLSFPNLGNKGFPGKALNCINFPEFAKYNPLAAEPHPPYPLETMKSLVNMSDVEKIIQKFEETSHQEKIRNLLLIPYNGHLSGDLLRFTVNVKNLGWNIPKDHHYENWREDYFDLLTKADAIILNPASELYISWLKNRRRDYYKFMNQAKTVVVDEPPIFKAHFDSSKYVVLENGMMCRIFFRRMDRSPAEEFDIITEALKLERTNKTAIKALEELESDNNKVAAALIEVNSLIESKKQNEKLKKLQLYLNSVKAVK